MDIIIELTKLLRTRGIKSKKSVERGNEAIRLQEKFA